MNRGTPRNILKELSMTGDDYNFVSTIYFVRLLDSRSLQNPSSSDSDTIHCIRGSIESDPETNASFSLSVPDHGNAPLFSVAIVHC